MRSFLRWLIRRLMNMVAVVEVHDRQPNLPESGAFIIATNHLGFLDAFLLYYSINRWDVFVPVAEKWALNPFYRWAGKYLNFVFIDRFNPDLRAMRTMIGLMERGDVLVIAPEGTRSRIGMMAEGKPGVSFLAARLRRPIVPIGLSGTEDKKVIGNLRRLQRSRITVRVGKPFELEVPTGKERDTVLKRNTDEIMCRIAALIPEKNRGVYAEHPRLKELLAQSP